MSEFSHKWKINVILECIDKALSEMGDGTAKSVYLTASRSFGLTREEIPERPEIFEKALEQVLGTGSVMVEIMITNQLIKVFNLDEKKCRFLKFSRIMSQLEELTEERQAEPSDNPDSSLEFL